MFGEKLAQRLDFSNELLILLLELFVLFPHFVGSSCAAKSSGSTTYYSFTDIYIAMAYRSLSAEQQARIDPMITGFNPADMYAADHIRRVLQTFPGVFTGIGDFTIHKEFVSSKVSGETASLTYPALDRILDFAAQVGLVVLIHNDVDAPFPKEGAEPLYLAQMKSLLKRHPNVPIIWAHCGVGRVVRPVNQHTAMPASILGDPGMRNVFFSLEPTKLLRQIRKSIFGSTTNRRHCGMHSLPRQAKMLGKVTTNGSLMRRGEKFERGKRLI